MKKFIAILAIAALTQRIFCGNICSSCQTNEFENQPTRQVAALARADTERLKKMTGSSSRKARTIKKRATIELNKHGRQKSREELERLARIAHERRLAFERRKKSMEESKESKKEEKKDSANESKTSESMNIVDV